MRMVSTWCGLLQRQARRNVVSGLSISILVLLTQCARFFPGTPVPLDATPIQILEAMTTHAEQLHDLEGKVSVRVDASDFRETAVAKILYRKPDRLKIEIKGPLGLTVANVQMKGDTVRVYYPLSNYLIQGKPTAEHFELMTGLRLDVGDFQRIILGEAGLAQEALDHLVDFEVDEKAYLLGFRWDGGMQKHWVEPRHLGVIQSEFYDHQGTLELRQKFKNYEKFEGLRLPTKIEIEREHEGQRVQLVLKEGKVNGGIAEDRFRLNVPMEVERIELSN